LAFDWKRFLSRHSIDYVTQGPNVARGAINVKCPFCGPADPSEHLGISLSGKGWGCWRNATHRGKSRARLIQALLRCSHERAQELAGGTVVTPQDNSFADQLSSMLTGEQVAKVERPTKLELPTEFKPLTANAGLAKPFVEYLQNRGYAFEDVWWAASIYDLHYCTRGDFQYRIIIPLYNEDQRLVSWVGRTIVPDTNPRYKALHVDSAIAAPGDTLLGLHVLSRLKDTRALVVCEGAFDAIRVSLFGRALGIWGTCLFGLNVSDSQSFLLEELSDRFEHVYLLLDEDASLQSFRLSQRLGRKCRPLRLPMGIGDPGELKATQAASLFAQMLT